MQKKRKNHCFVHLKSHCVVVIGIKEKKKKKVRVDYFSSNWLLSGKQENEDDAQSVKDVKKEEGISEKLNGKKQVGRANVKWA